MRKLLATLGLAVLLLGACGGDDNKSSSDTTAGSDSSVAPAAAAAAGGTFGDFCASRAGFSAPNPASSSDLKANLESTSAALEQAVKHSPSEIKADVSTLATAYKKFFAAIKAANYDFTKVNPDEVQAISTTDVQQAGERVTAWVAAHCK